MQQQRQLPPPWQPPPALRSAYTAGVATPPPAGIAPPPVPPPSAAKPDVNALLNSHLAQLGNIQGYRCEGRLSESGGGRGCGLGPGIYRGERRGWSL